MSWMREEAIMGMKAIRQIIEVYDYCPHSKDCDRDACPYFNRGYPRCYYGLIDDAINCLKKRIEEEDEE